VESGHGEPGVGFAQFKAYLHSREQEAWKAAKANAQRSEGPAVKADPS